jgi:hypothetical protein
MQRTYTPDVVFSAELLADLRRIWAGREGVAEVERQAQEYGEAAAADPALLVRWKAAGVLRPEFDPDAPTEVEVALERMWTGRGRASEPSGFIVSLRAKDRDFPGWFTSAEVREAAHQRFRAPMGRRAGDAMDDRTKGMKLPCWNCGAEFVRDKANRRLCAACGTRASGTRRHVPKPTPIQRLIDEERAAAHRAADMLDEAKVAHDRARRVGADPLDEANAALARAERLRAEAESASLRMDALLREIRRQG